MITKEEIKIYLGITTTDQDALIEMLKTSAINTLKNAIGVSNLESHSREEEIQVFNGSKLILSDFPVDISSIIVKTILDYEYTDLTFQSYNNSLRTIEVLNSLGVQTNIPEERAKVTYTAGYTYNDTMQVLSLTDLANKTITITIAGVSTTWTFKSATPSTNEILIGASVNDTATNIAAALGGTASTDTVTLPLGSSVALGTATTSQFIITNSNVPQELKACVAFIIGGGLSEQNKAGGISQLKIDDKSITFRNDFEKSYAQSIIDEYMIKYQKVNIYAV